MNQRLKPEIEFMVCQTLTRRIKFDFGNCIIFNIQSIIYKVTRYNNIIKNTINYKYLNIIIEISQLPILPSISQTIAYIIEISQLPILPSISQTLNYTYHYVILMTAYPHIIEISQLPILPSISQTLNYMYHYVIFMTANPRIIEISQLPILLSISQTLNYTYHYVILMTAYPRIPQTKRC